MDEQVNIPALLMMPMEGRIPGSRALFGYARRVVRAGQLVNPLA